MGSIQVLIAGHLPQRNPSGQVLNQKTYPSGQSFISRNMNLGIELLYLIIALNPANLIDLSPGQKANSL